MPWDAGTSGCPATLPCHLWGRETSGGRKRCRCCVQLLQINYSLQALQGWKRGQAQPGQAMRESHPPATRGVTSPHACTLAKGRCAPTPTDGSAALRRNTRPRKAASVPKVGAGPGELPSPRHDGLSRSRLPDAVLAPAKDCFQLGDVGAPRALAGEAPAPSGRFRALQPLAPLSPSKAVGFFPAGEFFKWFSARGAPVHH